MFNSFRDRPMLCIAQQFKRAWSSLKTGNKKRGLCVQLLRALSLQGQSGLTPNLPLMDTQNAMWGQSDGFKRGPFNSTKVLFIWDSACYHSNLKCFFCQNLTDITVNQSGDKTSENQVKVKYSLVVKRISWVIVLRDHFSCQKHRLPGGTCHLIWCKSQVSI